MVVALYFFFTHLMLIFGSASVKLCTIHGCENEKGGIYISVYRERGPFAHRLVTYLSLKPKACSPAKGVYTGSFFFWKLRLM